MYAFFITASILSLNSKKAMYLEGKDKSQQNEHLHEVEILPKRNWEKIVELGGIIKLTIQAVLTPRFHRVLCTYESTGSPFIPEGTSVVSDVFEKLNFLFFSRLEFVSCSLKF